MKNNILQLAIGLIIAVVAIVMLRGYLEDQKASALRQVQQMASNLKADQVAVILARKPIPAGTPITPSLIETTVVNRSDVGPDVVRSLAELDGKAAARAISPGEPITDSALQLIDVKKGVGGVERLSQAIPAGKRAMGLAVDNIASIIDMIKPGDYVDIIAVIAFPSGQGQSQPMNIPIFQNVLVLAVGDSFEQSAVEEVGSSIKKLVAKKEDVKKNKDAGNNPPVTVALDPDEITVISFVQEQGKIKLVLRSSGDTDTVNYNAQQMGPTQVPPVMDYNSFYMYLVSRGLVAPPRQPSQEESGAKQAEKKKTTVEVFRGQKKEVKEIEQ